MAIWFIAQNAHHLAPLTSDESADHLTQALHTLATEVPPELLAKLQAIAPAADATQELLTVQSTADLETSRMSVVRDSRGPTRSMR